MVYYIISIIIFLIDQFSKYWVKANLELYEPKNIIGNYLRFTFCENSGMAFDFQYAEV